MDKKVYPTKSPVTSENLAAWYSRNPEFGRVCEEDGKVAGMYVAIPLNHDSWDKFVFGENLSESDLKGEMIFDNSEDHSLGIHIYHIERFFEEKRFYQKAFADLGEIFKKLSQANPKLKLAGLSALCVTPAGIGLFEKLGFESVQKNNPEKMFFKDKNVRVVTNDSEQEIAVKDGYQFRNFCQMMAVSSEDSPKAEVWKYF